MAPVLSLDLVALDVLCAMGLGFFVGIIRAFLPRKNKCLCFFADLICTWFGLFLLQGYSASFAHAGELRFYMIISAIVGFYACCCTVAQFVVVVVDAVWNILCFCLKKIVTNNIKLTVFYLKKLFNKFNKQISQKKSTNKKKKSLQNGNTLLYNSNV